MNSASITSRTFGSVTGDSATLRLPLLGAASRRRPIGLGSSRGQDARRVGMMSTP